VREVWSSTTCPAKYLGFLAWALSVNEWDGAWPEATQRAVIASATAVHRRKGTVWSIKAALAVCGYPGAEVIEGAGGNVLYNGSNDRLHNGLDFYGAGTSNWASYRVKLPSPISNAQAPQVRRILANTAPARCVLQALEFSAVAATYNGATVFDGSFNYGTV
jgi:hypothetical protein